jgi:hypothetical protein
MFIEKNWKEIVDQQGTAYISTGDLNGFYTLKVYTLTIFDDGSAETKDHYIKNLSIDPKKADQMLKEYAQIHGCDIGAGADFKLDEHNKWSFFSSVTIDSIKKDRVFRFGKYSGQSFDAIIKNDLRYMQWLAFDEDFPDLTKRQSIFRLTIAAIQQLVEEGSISIPEKVEVIEEPVVEKKTSEFVGTVGGKIELDLEVVYRTFVNNMFGGSTLLIMVDKDGNVFKTFTNASWLYEPITDVNEGLVKRVVKGDKIKIAGLVAKHDIYNEEKSTILKRPKLIEVMKEAA